MVRKILKYLFRILLALIGLLIIAYIVLYIAMRGDYEVAKTVADNPDLPRIEINGTLLHAETFGDPANQAIIVLHGGPGNDYRHLLTLKPLADEYFMVFYDQRGSGLSERVPAEELSLESSIADLDAVIDYYSNGSKVNLIGHSWGGMLASGYIAKHPEKINKAVLAEPGFLTAELYDEFMKRTNGFALDLSFKLLKHFIITWFESVHVDGPDDQANADYFMSRLIWGTKIKNHPMAGYFCNDDIGSIHFEEWRFGALASRVIPQSGLDANGNSTIDLVSGLENYQDTVLIIAGECNRLIGADFQEMQMKYFNHAKLEIIEDTGHFMLTEKADESMGIIRDFFRKEE